MPAETSTLTAEQFYQKALESLDNKQYQQCIALLHSAMDQEKQEGSQNPRMKYLSLLGLALTLSQGRSEEGVKLCEQAAKRDFFDADLFCNLGIVYLRNRRRKEAFDAFRKGLILKPKHRRIVEELNRHERREHPVFPSLPRQHFLNITAGKLRYRFRTLFSGASLASD
jgi:tetratricopeptide (TPR) repeat protein